MNRKRKAICGRKTSTPPTPATIPSTARLWSGPEGMAWPTHNPAALKNPSIQSIKIAIYPTVRHFW
jgi:hypothetical protein